MHVLVLCHGNINRSPLFAAVLAKHTNYEIRSRGFGPSNVRMPKRTRELARAYGYDMTNYRSQQVTQEDFDWADCIIYMDNGQRARLSIQDRRRSYCAGMFVGRHRLPDPNFLSGPDFEHAIKLVIIAAESAATDLPALMKRQKTT